ncbi:hypothetical protein PSTG_11971 [Puccinia striiformis f. sp. tritici PST-78]|uniref:Uncharacterized protein n=1 Tax=Puccinia striiformis f. sp. tritici PST-78 TaxID=1165861 RepID=A0A0L0V5Z6_9BASI|nr:hypothetical protein PSTG_11971 [Puccinia striiformis f. sp. tritici PST-78]
MLDSSSEGSNATESDSSQETDYWPQDDLVLDGFIALACKYSPNSAPYDDDISDEAASSVDQAASPVDQAAFSVDQANLKQQSLEALTSHLPLLAQQLIKLSLSLDSAQFSENPGPTLKLILSIQSELDRTLDQIQSALHALYPIPPQSRCTRTNDQHHKGLKSFRLKGLYYRIEGPLLENVGSIFMHSHGFLHAPKLTTEDLQLQTAEASIRDQMTGFMLASSEEIKLAIEWLEGSEFNLVQKQWPMELFGINIQLEILMDLINRTTQLEEDEEHLSESATQLGKSLLPIIKLSRLFINKLMMRGMNKKYLPLFTEMRSDQMESLAGLARDVNGMVTQLMNFMRVADQSLASNISKFLTHTAKQLERDLLSGLSLFIIYFIPLIPDRHGFSMQDHLRSWFVTWCTQFSFAIQRLKDAAELYVNTSPALPESP